MCVLDRGKVVGGLPDVVTIMEKKVSVEFTWLFVQLLIHNPHVVKENPGEKKIFFVVAIDPEFNMHRVWRPQTSGVMAEKWSRSWTWWQGTHTLPVGFVNLKCCRCVTKHSTSHTIHFIYKCYNHVALAGCIPVHFTIYAVMTGVSFSLHE